MAKDLHFQIVPLPEVPLRLTLTEAHRRPVVLIVDDEPLIADTLVAILSKKNYVASAAYSAEEALVIAKVIPPEVLITDIMMPGMSGIDLAVTIKEMVPDCKVLLFSGHAHADLLFNDPRCASYDFPLFTKPVHPDALLACISNLAIASA